MKYSMLFSWACAICAITSGFALAQTSTKSADTSPIELPTIVVTGDETINVPGGTKNTPVETDNLNEKELSELNTLEKEPPQLLPERRLPTLYMPVTEYRGFVAGELGMHFTPVILAGYKADVDGYSLYARGGLDASSGHIDNADYSKFHVGLDAGYLAPEKYWILGGSRTDSRIRYEGQTFNLYADSTAPSRTIREFDLGADVTGSYDQFGYKAGISLESTTLTQDGDAAGSNVQGYVSVRSQKEGFGAGGSITVDLGSVRGTGVSFIEALAAGTYRKNKLQFHSELGIQLVENTHADGGAILAGAVGFEYLHNESMTITGRAWTGARQLHWRQLLLENPYTHLDAEVNQPVDNIGLAGRILYHPTTETFLSGEIRVVSVSNYSMFVPASTGTFSIVPIDALIASFTAEASLQVGQTDVVSAQLQAQLSSSDSVSSSVPYLAPFVLSGSYVRNWSESIQSDVVLAWNAATATQADTDADLPAWVRCDISTRWNVTERLGLLLSLQNIFDTSIQRWAGYEERGIFVSAGARWKF